MKNIDKSIRERLLNLSKAQDQNFNTLLTQYALQRLLYRLSISEYHNQFVLKGAWLFVVWNNILHRPTRDLDLLGYGANDQQSLLTLFKAVVTIDVEQEDGLVFDASSFSAEPIKKDGDYQGMRIQGKAILDSAIIPLQVDIGFGDAVTPAAQMAALPSLLDLPAAQLRVYPVYTAVAEKFQAMVHLGEINSRIKDFYDLLIIANTQTLNSDNLQAAIQATFERRNTPITQTLVFVFSDRFKNDANKVIQWQAFLKKNKLVCPLTFAELVTRIELFIQPIYQQIGTGLTTTKQWNAHAWSWK